MFYLGAPIGLGFWPAAAEAGDNVTGVAAWVSQVGSWGATAWAGISGDIEEITDATLNFNALLQRSEVHYLERASPLTIRNTVRELYANPEITDDGLCPNAVTIVWQPPTITGCVGLTGEPYTTTFYGYHYTDAIASTNPSIFNGSLVRWPDAYIAGTLPPEPGGTYIQTQWRNSQDSEEQAIIGTLPDDIFGTYTLTTKLISYSPTEAISGTLPPDPSGTYIETRPRLAYDAEDEAILSTLPTVFSGTYVEI